MAGMRRETMATEAFEINEPMVISETIDGETVIINLDSGSYYSLKHSGAMIWAGIEKAAPVADIATSLGQHFGIDGERATVEVAKLVARLREENLIRPAAVANGAGTALAAVAMAEPFVVPHLEKFTDMEAMLLLDPVHDVDEEGWPHLPAGAGPQDA